MHQCVGGNGLSSRKNAVRAIVRAKNNVCNRSPDTAWSVDEVIAELDILYCNNCLQRLCDALAAQCDHCGEKQHTVCFDVAWNAIEAALGPLDDYDDVP